MRKFESVKKLVRWTDVIVVAIFLTVVAFLFYQSRPNLSWQEAMMHPDEAKELMMQDIQKTPLHPLYDASLFSHRYKTLRINVIGWLSEKPLTNPFVYYFNTMQSWVADCSSCSDAGDVCVDLEKIIIEYPIDINQDRLISKMQNLSDRLMIIDVRDVDVYLQGHIPGSVNLPLFQLIDWTYPMDRWTEIVIVGESYFQTKVAAESLRRLYFHRLHRLITPVQQWNGEIERFV